MHGFRRTLFLSHLGLVPKLGEGVIETARGYGYRVRST
jgi:hypothetical protein